MEGCKIEEIKIKELFNLDETIAKLIFLKKEYPWEILPEIGDFIKELGCSLDKNKFEKIKDDIWVAKSAEIANTASITGPCIIDEEAQIRHCAYIRGKVIIGKKAVVRKFNRIKKCYFI